MTRRSSLICVFLLCIVAYTLPATAQPWTITVTTNIDELDTPWTDCPPPGNNDCSLREAILVANFNGASGDTIVFNSSLDGATIVLDPSLGSLWIGNDDGTTIDATMLLAGITIDANGVQYPVVLDINQTTIMGPITITNAGAGGVAVVINTTASSSTLDSINVTGNPNVGIGVDSPTNINITNVTVTNNGSAGISLYGSSASMIQISNCTVSNNGGMGIFIGNASAVTIVTNTISNNQGAGVSVNNSSVIAIRSNTITGNGQDGISSGVIVVGASSNITIDGNTISNNGGNGISILEDFATDTAPQGVRIFLNTISNNGFLAGDGAGIQIAGAVTGVDPSICFGVGAGGSVSISANYIYGNAAQGILIERTPFGSNGPQNVCIGIDVINGGPENYIYDNGQEGVLLRDVGTSNNIVASSYIGTTDGVTPAPNGNAGVSIYGGATNNTVQGNTIRYNQYQNVLISGVGTTGNIVRDNTIQGGTDSSPPQGYNNAGVVINLGASKNVIGPTNFIQYHYYDGVQVVGPGTDDNEISRNTITNNGLGIAVLNDYPGPDSQLGPPTPGPANTLIQINLITDNNNEGIFIRRDNGGTVIRGNDIARNNGEGILLIGSSPSIIHSNTIVQNAANGILALVYFGADDSPASANDDVLSQPTIKGNGFLSNGAFGVLAIDTPLGDLNAINGNNRWESKTLGRVQQDWYGYVRVVDSLGNPVTGLTVQIDQNAPCTGSYTSAVSDPNGNYGPNGFDINSARTYFQITEAFVTNDGTYQNCTPQTVHDVPTTISGTYAYNGDYPNPLNEQGGAVESPPGSGVDRYQFALLQQQQQELANLSISKLDNPDPVLVGNNLTYTITVTNSGPSTATNVVVTDTLPAGVVFVSAVPSQGSCNPPVGNVVTCNLGNINAGDSVTITIVVQPTDPGTITNTAEVSSDTADPDPANNTASEDTTVQPVANLSISKLDNPDPVLAGNNLTYTITVTNSGPSTATNVVVTDTLPAGVVFVSAVPSQGSCNPPVGNVITCNLGNINAGDSVTITITVTPTEPGTITNTAEVSSDTADPDPPNNTASADTTVEQGPVGGDPPIWGTLMVFPTPEQHYGRGPKLDLNRNKSLNDCVLRVRDLQTGQVTNTGIFVSCAPRDLDLYEQTVAFVTPEGKLGLFDFATGAITRTDFAAAHPAIYGKFVVFEHSDQIALWDGSSLELLGLGRDPVIWGNVIVFVGPANTLQVYDLERGELSDTGVEGAQPAIYEGVVAFVGGDRAGRRPVIRLYEIATGHLEETTAIGSQPAIYGRYVVFQTDEALVGSDLNGDGDRADTVIRYYDRELRRVFSTALVGAEPDIYDGLIAFWVYESSYGQDLNGDGDRVDPIVQTYRIPTEAVSAPLRVARIALERVDRHGVRFVVEGEGIEAVRVEIYDLQGRVLYRSEFVPGQRVVWYGRGQDGTLLANGVYLAVLTIKGSDRVERSGVQKLVLLR